MSIYLIYILGMVNIVLVLKYLIEGIYTQRKKIEKQQVSIKFIESLKE